MKEFLHRGHSQSGEEGVIAECVRRLSIREGWIVDVGACDGATYSNSLALIQQGWNAVLIEGSPTYFEHLKSLMSRFPKTRPVCQYVSAEPGSDLDPILRCHGVPRDFDVLSIDVDGNDYWIWESTLYSPKVVVIEYNPQFPPSEAKVIAYDPHFRYGGDDYYGASARALFELASRKGYTLVFHTEGLNLFFVRNEFAGRFEPWHLGEIRMGRFHKQSARKMVDLHSESARRTKLSS